MSIATCPLGTSDLATMWMIHLDRLELDVMRAEQALTSGSPIRTDVWHPPLVSGPPPPDQLERARDILARQEACLEVLDTQLGGAARQHAMAMAISRATVPDHCLPVYVDDVF